MLINFPKFLLFLILFLGTKFANSTDDKNFIEKCKEISAELKFRIQVNSTPPKLPIQPGSSPTNEIMTYREHPLIASGEEFDEFIAGEIKFLAVKLSKIGQRIKNKETSFDRDVKIFVNHFRKEIKNDEIHHIIWNTMLKKDLGEFFDTLNQFLWKIDDKNLKKIEKNGKVLIEYTEKFPPIVKSVSGANHSTGNALVSIEYIAARKMINEFIKVLKMEIVYGQGIAAIIEIKEIHEKIAKTFKEKFEEIQKGKNKIQLTKFITGEKKDPRKYNDLYLYNLLNYAIIELHKILVEFVADTVDGKENKILKIRSIVLTEQFVKPMLRKVFDETMTMPGTQETRKFMKPIASSYKIIENEPSSSSRNRKKGNDTEAINVKFEYDLVKKMEMDLGLTTNFFKIEQFILNEKVSTEHGMVVSKSKIRIAAAKLILAYERLKAIYSGKIELNDDEKKEAKEMEDKLSKDYVYETNANK